MAEVCEERASASRCASRWRRARTSGSDRRGHAFAGQTSCYRRGRRLRPQDAGSARVDRPRPRSSACAVRACGCVITGDELLPCGQRAVEGYAHRRLELGHARRPGRARRRRAAAVRDPARLSRGDPRRSARRDCRRRPRVGRELGRSGGPRAAPRAELGTGSTSTECRCGRRARPEVGSIGRHDPSSCCPAIR